MRRNQRLPTIFGPHQDWILEVLDDISFPKAWIFHTGRWHVQVSHQTSGRIESLEYTLVTQDNIGVLGFSASINAPKDAYTILYLYDGAQFSHTIFQPVLSTSTLAQPPEKKWWVEPWNIEHML